MRTILIICSRTHIESGLVHYTYFFMESGPRSGTTALLPLYSSLFALSTSFSAASFLSGLETWVPSTAMGLIRSPPQKERSPLLLKWRPNKGHRPRNCHETGLVTPSMFSEAPRECRQPNFPGTPPHLWYLGRNCRRLMPAYMHWSASSSRAHPHLPGNAR